MPGFKKPMSKESAIKQARRMGKQAMTSDAAYRVEAKKGGKMNAGLKAFLAKKKKKKGKK
tara:strand:+ start:45 stop:224 length:180 start_codon:yes stop_codon:yes gene_type:complete